MTRRVRVLAALLAAVVMAGVAGYAQDFFGGRRRAPSEIDIEGNAEYDGRLVFVRIQYSMGFSGFGRRRGGQELPWAHDYPTADVHMMKIMKELTLASPRTEGSNVLSLDDPELFKYPIAYMSEPGFWVPSEEEVTGLRNYLLKGGFIIFDDFRADHWYNLEEQMRRVFPESRFRPLDATHPIFNSFFEIKSLDFSSSGYFTYGPVVYYGMYEDNDPNKRLLAVANLNQDLGEYWEYSDTGWVPIDLSNEAYKFGVNYFIYGLTH